MSKWQSRIIFCFLGLSTLGLSACGPTAENSAANALDNAGSAVRSLGGPPFYYNDGRPEEVKEPKKEEEEKKSK